MPLCAPTLSAQPFRGIPIRLYFHLEPCGELPFTPSQSGVGMCHPHPWRNTQERNYLLIFLSVRWRLGVVSQNRPVKCIQGQQGGPEFDAIRSYPGTTNACWQIPLGAGLGEKVSFDDQSAYTLERAGE